MLDSWDAADDSEVEREKAKKATEAAEKAAAKAKADHKTKTQRIEARKIEKQRRLDAGEDDESDEDDAARLARAREAEKVSDMNHASDLFGDIGISNNRSAPKPVTIRDASDPTKSVELSSLELFTPTKLSGFMELRETLAPLLTQNSKSGFYPTFVEELTKLLSKDLNSEQIKKIISSLTTLSNVRQKEEKTLDKTGKKTKAAKTKTTLSASRNLSQADTTVYGDDGLGE